MPIRVRDDRELTLESFVTELGPDIIHRNDHVAKFKLYGHIKSCEAVSSKDCFEPLA
jgi:hypothetical protein